MMISFSNMDTLPTSYMDWLEWQISTLAKEGRSDEALEKELWKQKRFAEIVNKVNKLKAQADKRIARTHDHDQDFQEKNHQEEVSLSNYESQMYSEKDRSTYTDR